MCSTKLHKATELLSSVHSVSSGSFFTLSQKGWVESPLKIKKKIHQSAALLERSDHNIQSDSVVHPLLAGFANKVTAESFAPAQRLRHRVVGFVPASVLHERQRHSRIHWILSVSPRHSFILTQKRQRLLKKKTFTNNEI